MRLAFDIGNTRTKVALLGDDGLKECSIFEKGRVEANAVEAYVATLCRHYDVEDAVACVVGETPCWEQVLPKGLPLQILSASSPLPFVMGYASPDTVGSDRLAGVMGATKLFPCQSVVVIDAGSCVTVDYLDNANTYRGGAILPGIRMKLKAMNQYTERLPLLEFAQQDVSVVGTTTAECMLSGALWATLFEIEGYVSALCQISPCKVLVTGGDGLWIKNHAHIEMEYCPDLLFQGLSRLPRIK